MAYFDGSAELVSLLVCILALYMILACSLALADLLARRPGHKRRRNSRGVPPPDLKQR